MQNNFPCFILFCIVKKGGLIRNYSVQKRVTNVIYLWLNERSEIKEMINSFLNSQACFTSRRASQSCWKVMECEVKGCKDAGIQDATKGWQVIVVFL